jgi:hypothetical protein
VRDARNGRNREMEEKLRERCVSSCGWRGVSGCGWRGVDPDTTKDLVEEIDNLEAELAAEREQRAILNVNIAVTVHALDEVRADYGKALERIEELEGDLEMDPRAGKEAEEIRKALEGICDGIAAVLGSTDTAELSEALEQVSERIGKITDEVDARDALAYIKERNALMAERNAALARIETVKAKCDWLDQLLRHVEVNNKSLADALADAHRKIEQRQRRCAPLKGMGEQIRTQDNLATADPIFAVQRCVRTYGLDLAWVDDYVWINGDGNEWCPGEEGSPEDPDDEWFTDNDYRAVGYRDAWITVQPFFTRAGAQRYLEENAHNLTGPEPPRIYVESAYRNREWQAVRAFLLGMEGTR